MYQLKRGTIACRVTTKNILTILSRVHEVNRENTKISRGTTVSMPLQSTDLSPYNFTLWGELKDQMYSNNSLTLGELQQNTESSMDATSQSELLHMSYSLINQS
ncbi:hypothetical protein NPIL_565391 [Nephila pilipes]|uniref:Uncharacterized protein n=1 Tax=Nephila pilipes TaxID=299642 RepID=A0A8X6P8U8_NEPPI|nr:hypothetical protein NPIL_565391 [Nephila pilipes]